MSISSICSSESSLEIFSDEELDEYGNLMDLVVDNEPPRRSERIAKLKRKRVYSGEEDHLKKRLKKSASSYSILQGKITQEMYSALDGMHPKKIIGRDTESLEIISKVLGGIRPLLLGVTGIGKFSLVKKVAEMMKTTYKRHPLGNRTILCIDCNELRAQNTNERIVNKLRYIMDTTDTIFYFRHIERLLHLENLTDYIQSILKQPYSIIASISDDSKSETVIKAEEILKKYHFQPYEVKELGVEDIRMIAKEFLTRNRLHKNLVFSEEAVNIAVTLAGKYDHSYPFPIKAINLLQECAATLILQEHEKKMIVTPNEIAEFVSKKTKIPFQDLIEDSIFNQKNLKKDSNKALLAKTMQLEL